jgi:hypothetical protein
MRVHLIAAAAGVLAVTGCNPAPDVHTSVPPDAGLGNRLTFQLRSEPGYLGGPVIGAYHPAAVNSATSQALRADIAASLTRQGYVEGEGNPGVLIVYYLTVPPVSDVTDWGYGYLWRPDWARGEIPGSVNLSPAEYANGAVVIDMIDPSSGALLWQGHAVARRPDDERMLARDLRQTVASIISRVPGPSVAIGMLAPHPSTE